MRLRHCLAPSPSQLSPHGTVLFWYFIQGPPYSYKRLSDRLIWARVYHDIPTYLGHARYEKKEKFKQDDDNLCALPIERGANVRSYPLQPSHTH
jgi:hypothetical protein